MDQGKRSLHSEHGSALVFALMVMMVLIFATTGLLGLAVSNRTAAARSLDAVQASNLAREALSDAHALLWNVSDPTKQGSFPAVPTAVATPAGQAYLWGQLSGTTWTLWGRGVAAAGLGRTVTRTVSRQVQIVPGNGAITDLRAWNMLYSDAKTGCMTLSNNATLKVPLYVAGNLCISNNAGITGSTTTLQVGGTLTLAPNAIVGTTSTRLASVNVVGGCGSPPHLCTAADGIHANSIGTTLSGISKPPIDLASWRTNAPLGPNHPCTVGALPAGVTFTGATVNLFPSSDYDCRATDAQGNILARLTWNHTTHIFQIAGTIFFDGDLTTTNNTTVIYQGQATIYTAKTATFSNNVTVCGSTSCNSSWDPNTNLLVLVAGSSTASTDITASNNAVFQGGAYAVNDIDFSNNGTIYGPAIARQLYISNNATFPPITKLPPGAPAIITTAATPTSLTPVTGSTRTS